ncbi:MAG TPA: AraC family transcriptional regulator, partial [Longimicrobiaceae bacterium]|nr:AraC family transcriptional regulator [Longimicrobiaceae bacterium]
AHAAQSRGADFHLAAGETNLVVVPPAGGTFELKQESRGEVFEVMLSHAYFAGLAARHPHLLEGFLEGMQRDAVCLLGREHPRMTPQMWGVVQRIRRHGGEHSAGSLFLEAQILELLGMQLAGLRQPPRPGGLRLSRSDVDGIHAARELLLARLADPPSLAELARHALTNEFKLKRGFKALFGTSPYAYLLEHRLELARAHLLDTEWTVAEIARRVGYSDPAHLTHAFRKRYGQRPSDLRPPARPAPANTRTRCPTTP